jgi:L-lactate dehydrogenase (cytochrome)
VRDAQAVHWSEVKRFVGPSLRRGGLLERVRTADDLARLARRRVPRPVFDYVEGGAEREASVRRATDAFDRVTFHPHVLRDVSAIDPSSSALGRPVAFPVVLGPTGFTRMMHTAGEPAVARAAARAGVPYALSTMGTTSVEALPAVGDRWFQLYLWRDRGRSRELVQRAADAGYTTLVLTVDVVTQGGRWRDVRNGLTIPPTLTPRTLAAMAARPRWVWDHLTTDPLTLESLSHGEELHELINTVFEPAVTPADVEWLRSVWPGSLVVKGLQRVDDAKACVAAGADGIAVSNHGGRQLDRAATPLDALPAVVDAVGTSAEVYLDGGVRSGADVAAAVALGATAAFVARPYLYALMAAGEAGVDHLLGLLHADYVRTLALLGVTRTADLDRDLVSVVPD